LRFISAADTRTQDADLAFLLFDSNSPARGCIRFRRPRIFRPTVLAARKLYEE
jgi:hypothetical protein